MGRPDALDYHALMRFTLPLLVLVLSANVLESQEPISPRVLAVASEIDACFLAPDRPSDCVIQTGRTGAVLDLGRSEPVTRSVFSLPAGTFVWDLTPDEREGYAFFALSADGLRWRRSGGPWRHIEGTGGFFRGNSTHAPLHRTFARRRKNGFACAIPTGEGMKLIRFGGGKPPSFRSIDAPIHGRQSLGWGLGDTMEARRIVPGVRPFSGSRWLVALRGALSTWNVSDSARPWARMPLDRSTDILGFEHIVEDLLEDVDGDGTPDLLFTDPGHGRLLVYLGRDRMADEPRGPDQILQKEGWIVGRFFLPGTPTSPPTLGVLRVPRLSLVAQVTVLRKGILPAEVTLHVWNGTRFDPTPKWIRKVALPFEIHLTSARRRLRLRAPLSVHSGPEGALLVLPDAEAGITVFEVKGEQGKAKGRLSLPAKKASLRFPAPLAGVWGHHDGGFSFSAVVEDPEDGIVRVLAWDVL